MEDLFCLYIDRLLKWPHEPCTCNTGNILLCPCLVPGYDKYNPCTFIELYLQNRQLNPLTPNDL
jgi:hypothetical protein